MMSNLPSQSSERNPQLDKPNPDARGQQNGTRDHQVSAGDQSLGNMKDWHEPLTTDMIHFQQTLCLPLTPHSVDQVMYDWEVCGTYAGFWLSEWAQEANIHH